MSRFRKKTGDVARVALTGGGHVPLFSGPFFEGAARFVATGSLVVIMSDSIVGPILGYDTDMFLQVMTHAGVGFIYERLIIYETEV